MFRKITTAYHLDCVRMHEGFCWFVFLNQISDAGNFENTASLRATHLLHQPLRNQPRLASFDSNSNQTEYLLKNFHRFQGAYLKKLICCIHNEADPIFINANT